MTIRGFQGEHRWLSNFWPLPGHDGKTVEHYFQAAKATNGDDSEWVMSAETPGKAKRCGRKIQVRENWDEIKLGVMVSLLRMKFQDPELRQRLLDTDDEELIEGNHWHDNFWGDCECGRLECAEPGENHLGHLLMNLRDEIGDSLAYDGSDEPPRRELTARERDILCRVLRDIITPYRRASQHLHAGLPIRQEDKEHAARVEGVIDLWPGDVQILCEIKHAIDPRRD